MELFVILGLGVVFISSGATLGRIDGGGILKMPELVERLLIMSFFVGAVLPFAGYWSALALIGMFGIATGHGQYFLHRVVKYIDPEKVDFLVKLVFGKDPRTNVYYADNESEYGGLRLDLKAYGETKLYWRCVFGMFVTGTLVGLPASIIAIVFGQYLIAGILALTGFAKAIAYIVGYEIWESTEPAEFINGGLRNLLVYISLCTLFI